MPLNVIIGGPSYQMLVDARHAGSMAALAITMRELGMLRSIQIEYRHGCPVEHARNDLFKNALKSGADALFWADADCYWPDAGNREIAWLLMELNRTGLPFASIPVAQRDGTPNIVIARNGARWERASGTVKVERKLLPCVATGLGTGAFNLGWYRKHWPEAPWFRTDWSEGTMISEDFWHTHELLTRGDKPGPRWAPILPVTHAARGVAGPAS